MIFRLETEAAKQTVLAFYVTCNFEWQAGTVNDKQSVPESCDGEL
jgi:hypothetical protein